jgi:methenyltetrahydromethanopterin cyclohydrolase
MKLNQRALQLCQDLLDDAQAVRAVVQAAPGGGTIFDLGIEAAGGLEAGRRMAEICLAGLGHVSFARSSLGFWDGPSLAVATDHPVAACMASQYAGWKLAVGKFFAMGSGPMRAAAGKEALFERIDCRETTDAVVGVLETRQTPPPEVIELIARECGVRPAAVTLLIAPTASQAGTVQIVARSIETALHKLFELDFDLSRIESGWGVAPLPPVAADDMTAIGRTNDAILYGGEVTLWVRGDDASLEAIGPRIPSSASPDHGQPFREIFERYDRDFYRVDPQLFSPATVTLANLDTGHWFRFGETMPEVLERSFAS